MIKNTNSPFKHVLKVIDKFHFIIITLAYCVTTVLHTYVIFDIKEVIRKYDLSTVTNYTLVTGFPYRLYFITVIAVAKFFYKR